MSARLLTHSENRFARFVTWVSFLGLALGVTVLTVVVTVMNGFDDELKNRLLQSIPHVTVADAKVGDPISDVAANLAGVRSVSNYFRGLGAVAQAGEIYPVGIYATDAAGLADMDDLRSHMHGAGLDALADNVHGVVMGDPLARALGVYEGDQVLLLSVETEQETVRPKMVRLTVVDTFTLDAEPDYNLLILNLAHFPPAQWARMGELGLQLQLDNPLAAGQVAVELQQRYAELEISSWEDEYGELFQAVQLEKSMMFLILLLVVAIASFNIIAGQTMLVNDKRRSIAILRTMGCTQGVIRSVFLIQGAAISLIGTALGLVLGLLASSQINQLLDGIQSLTGMHLLDGSFFVVVPTLVLPADLVLISLMSAGLCLLSAWMPAKRAALLDPVANLH